jgi:ABC-type dipeptide/oligopeptide/nickel transport system permease subunit
MQGFTTPISRIAVLILVLMLVMTIFAPYLTRHDPLAINMRARLEPPSMAHILGTDALGRDFYSRILHGGRISIVLSIVITSLAMITGLCLGIVTGYRGGILDRIILGITNVFLGLPGLTLMVAIAGIMGPGVKTILVALSLTSWMGFSRIVRAEVMKIREQDFMEGVRVMGGSHFYLIIHHIIPNIRAICLVTFTTRVSRSVIVISSLSYLGFGLEPPTPDWGVMIRDALNYFRSAPHLIIAPGMCIFLLTFSINIIGDSFRDFFDVRL